MKISEMIKLTQKIPVTSLRPNEPLVLEQLFTLGIVPGNLYQEMEMESSLVDTHQDISSSNANVQLHSHAFYELLYCRNTCGAEYLVGSERYKLEKGDVIFVPPGTSHRPILPPTMTEPYIRDVVWLSTELAESLGLSSSQAVPTLLRTAGTKWEFLGELFRNGVTESERREASWQTIVLGNTLTLMANLIRAHNDTSTNSLTAEKPELLEQLLAHIEQHMNEKISLADVARHFYISESTITQTFRKKMGVSFYRYVTQRRLIAAKGLIHKGMSMEAVGEQVGFSDYSSFFRAFKQEYGISPSQYKKLQNAVPDNK